MFKIALSTLILICLAFLSSCQSSTILTAHSFDAISIGSDICKVEEHYGAPYQITTNAQGFQEYLYIERLDISYNVTDQVHYVLVTLNGKVIDKRIQNSGRAALNFKTP